MIRSWESPAPNYRAFQSWRIRGTLSGSSAYLRRQGRCCWNNSALRLKWRVFGISSGRLRFGRVTDPSRRRRRAAAAVACRVVPNNPKSRDRESWWWMFPSKILMAGSRAEGYIITSRARSGRWRSSSVSRSTRPLFSPLSCSVAAARGFPARPAAVSAPVIYDYRSARARAHRAYTYMTK